MNTEQREIKGKNLNGSRKKKNNNPKNPLIYKDKADCPANISILGIQLQVEPFGCYRGQKQEEALSGSTEPGLEAGATEATVDRRCV